MELNLVKSAASLKLARGHYDLIKLSHSGFTQDYYLVNNNENVEYEGNEYLAFPFGIVKGSKTEIAGANIVFSNVSREIGVQLQKAIESASSESIICEHKQVTLELFNGDIIVGAVSNAVEFELLSPIVTNQDIQAGLIIRYSLDYNYSKRTLNTNDFPNINI